MRPAPNRRSRYPPLLCWCLRSKEQNLVSDIFRKSINANYEIKIDELKMIKLLKYATENPANLETVCKTIMFRVSDAVVKKRYIYVALGLMIYDRIWEACLNKQPRELLPYTIESFAEVCKEILSSSNPAMIAEGIQIYRRLCDSEYIKFDDTDYLRYHPFLLEKLAWLSSEHSHETYKTAALLAIQGLIKKALFYNLKDLIWLPQFVMQILSTLLYNVDPTNKTIKAEDARISKECYDMLVNSSKTPNDLKLLCAFTCGYTDNHKLWQEKCVLAYFVPLKQKDVPTVKETVHEYLETKVNGTNIWNHVKEYLFAEEKLPDISIASTSVKSINSEYYANIEKRLSNVGKKVVTRERRPSGVRVDTRLDRRNLQRIVSPDGKSTGLEFESSTLPLAQAKPLESIEHQKKISTIGWDNGANSDTVTENTKGQPVKLTSDSSKTSNIHRNVAHESKPIISGGLESFDRKSSTSLKLEDGRTKSTASIKKSGGKEKSTISIKPNENFETRDKSPKSELKSAISPRNDSLESEINPTMKPRKNSNIKNELEKDPD